MQNVYKITVQYPQRTGLNTTNFNKKYIEKLNPFRDLDWAITRCHQHQNLGATEVVLTHIRTGKVLYQL